MKYSWGCEGEGVRILCAAFEKHPICLLCVVEMMDLENEKLSS